MFKGILSPPKLYTFILLVTHPHVIPKPMKIFLMKSVPPYVTTTTLTLQKVDKDIVKQLIHMNRVV